MMIAPVTKSFPIHRQCQESSQLPFSMTVTPLLVVLPLDHVQPQPQPPPSISSSISLSLLTNIPKCYHCGAPHSSSFTQERLFHPNHHHHNDHDHHHSPMTTDHPLDDDYNNNDNNNNNNNNSTNRMTNTTTTTTTGEYFCRLCHQTFHHHTATKAAIQQQQQQQSTNPITKYNNENENDTNDDIYQQQRMELQRHQTPKVRNTSRSTSTTTTTTTNQTQSPNIKQQQQIMEETHVFDLPLRLPNHQSSSMLYDYNNNNHKEPIYRMDSLSCPIIWYICLDGGSHAMIHTSYWQTVADTIQSCLFTAPCHVHIAIVIASQLDPLSLLLHNDHQYHPNDHNTNHHQQQQSPPPPPLSEQQQQQQQAKLLSIYDLHSPIPKLNHYTSDEMAWSESDMIHTILYEHAPVPYISSFTSTTSPQQRQSSSSSSSSNYQTNVAAVLRSLVDYPNTVTTRNNNNNNQSIYRCPVGWVTEVLLTSLQHGAIHVGHRNNHQYSQSTTTESYNNNNDNSNNHNHNDTSSSGMTNPTATTIPSKIIYGGMKVTFFLCDQASGTTTTTIGMSNSSNHNINHHHAMTTTGNAMRTIHQPSSPIGERYSYHPNNNNNSNNNLKATINTELTPQQLHDRYYRPSSTSSNTKKKKKHQPTTTINDSNSIVEYYADLGRECSDMAMGVDLILLYDSTTTTTTTTTGRTSTTAYHNNHPNTNCIDFALPIIQPLSERSGAAIPLLFDLATIEEQEHQVNHNSNHSDPSNNTNSQSMTRFQREVLSRTPWQNGRVYGAELRVRVSPGYMVDPDTVTMIPNVVGPQLAPIYNEVGCIGPASSVNESSQLWRMGTSDQHTSYTFDLTMVPHTIVRDHITLHDGLVVASVDENTDENIITLYPVIQICFAYTTIVSETDETTGIVRYYTIRQMRITNRIVPFAYSVEALYASIDTEALAVVLYHRIALSTYQDGIIAAATMTQQWLQSLLVCIYKSAMEQFNREEQNRQDGFELYGTGIGDQYDKSHRYFNPGERLLFLEGELSAEDVLLAQGHDRLRPIVLMVYLLLQCDAFRCSSDYFCPSYDTRSATLSRMSSMTPTSLTRCIAPRIQLWESGIDVMEPIYDVLDLRSDAIQAAILECTTTTSTTKSGRSSPGLILFLDTPDQVVVMDARYVNDTNLRINSATGSNTEQQKRQQSPSKRKTALDDPLIVGIGLQNAISEAANSYRVRPPIIYELHQSDTYGERTLLRLVDHLIEDTYHIASQSENFNEWKSQIAQDVQVDVDNLLQPA